MSYNLLLLSSVNSQPHLLMKFSPLPSAASLPVHRPHAAGHASLLLLLLSPRGDSVYVRLLANSSGPQALWCFGRQSPINIRKAIRRGLPPLLLSSSRSAFHWPPNWFICDIFQSIQPGLIKVYRSILFPSPHHRVPSSSFRPPTQSSPSTPLTSLHLPPLPFPLVYPIMCSLPSTPLLTMAEECSDALNFFFTTSLGLKVFGVNCHSLPWNFGSACRRALDPFIQFAKRCCCDWPAKLLLPSVRHCVVPSASSDCTQQQQPRRCRLSRSTATQLHHLRVVVLCDSSSHDNSNSGGTSCAAKFNLLSNTTTTSLFSN
eukprot:GHVS01103653.1.p1 GENE.GHVS01103653.1~~GHVS01103653.1.p1  ORF type:complete len:317 (-),score=58.12 GHVS01103653.1:293-1243(-)